MNEQLQNAKEELKRVDHLIYVSLKYTRTVDVLRNVIGRLINAFDFVADSLLARAEEDGKISVMPTAPKMKCEKILEIYKDDIIKDFIKLYLLLRRIHAAEYARENEYRRHVTMVSRTDSEEIRIDIDKVTEYYKQGKDLIEHIERNIS
jgi:hypothetical protein